MVADQIRTTVEARKLVKKSTGDVLGTITISIGVAQFAPGETVETVIRRADACLYGAKQQRPQPGDQPGRSRAWPRWKPAPLNPPPACATPGQALS